MQVSHDGIDGLPAHGDRPSPRRAKGKKQSQAEPDRAHPVFRRRRFLSGTEASELQWFTPAGTPMNSGDWADPSARSIAIYSTDPTTPTVSKTARS